MENTFRLMFFYGTSYMDVLKLLISDQFDKYLAFASVMKRYFIKVILAFNLHRNVRSFHNHFSLLQPRFEKLLTYGMWPPTFAFFCLVCKLQTFSFWECKRSHFVVFVRNDPFMANYQLIFQHYEFQLQILWRDIHNDFYGQELNWKLSIECHHRVGN